MSESDLKSFEGMWLIRPPTGIACAKIVNGKLFIAYSRSEDRKLAGHYFDCQIVGGKLVGRFELFDGGITGVFFLRAGEHFTLKGGWWTDDVLPKSLQSDFGKVTTDLPGMIETVWVLMPKAKTPPWATQYFLEWPGH